MMIFEVLNILLSAIYMQFPDCKVSDIRDQFANLFILIDQMLDYGIPVIYDPKILSQLLSTDNLFSKITKYVSGNLIIKTKMTF